MKQSEAMVNELEEMRNTVYNLRLYLTTLKNHYVNPDDWQLLEAMYSGLGGFVEVEADESLD